MQAAVERGDAMSGTNRIVRRAIVLSALLLLAGGGARAATDECDEGWTAASLLRGPTAMLNAPLVPFRSAAGGVQAAAQGTEHSVRGNIILAPVVVFGGAATGLVEMAIWLGTGLADTLTGGVFRIAPEEATQLSAAPMQPAFTPESRRPKVVASADRCRR
jgi:hypothetical protein